MKTQRGFTLMELMIALAIAAIIANFALSSYQDQMNKTRRADAKVALTSAAGKQELYYIRNNQYTGSVNDLGGSSGSLTSPEGYYTITVDNSTGCSSTGSCFTLTATVDGSGVQAGDTKCWTFTLTDTGLKTAKDNENNASTDCW